MPGQVERDCCYVAVCCNAFGGRSRACIPPPPPKTLLVPPLRASSYPTHDAPSPCNLSEDRTQCDTQTPTPAHPHLAMPSACASMCHDKRRHRAFLDSPRMARNILMACHSSLQTTPVMLRLVGQCSVLDCVNVPQPWAKAYSKTHVGKQTTNCACTMCCNNTMLYTCCGEQICMRTSDLKYHLHLCYGTARPSSAATPNLTTWHHDRDCIRSVRMHTPTLAHTHTPTLEPPTLQHCAYPHSHIVHTHTLSHLLQRRTPFVHENSPAILPSLICPWIDSLYR